MALKLAAKAPTAVLRYVWTPQVLEGDGPLSATLTVTTGDAVIDNYAVEADSVAFFLSGGTAGTTTIISAAAITNEGETLPETIYIPILSRAIALDNTVRDVCNYALRPIVGLGGSPSANELADAQEHLDDMLAMWAESGADLGVKLPTSASDILYVSDAALQGIKNNLRMRLGEVYGKPVDQVTALSALRGLQQIKTALLPVDREGVDYF